MLPIALVVEDNSVVRDFIRLKLETSGWKVREAENASSALEQFRQQRPHLVTLDLILPINDGFDAMHLARFIKDEAPEVALLVVSAVGSKQDIKEFMHKHDLEVFDKSPQDPCLKNLFSRTDVLLHELSAHSLLL
jgi:two-component system chemotaxis response regulator CheY